MNIASTLLWVIGIINFLGGIVIAIPMIEQGKPIASPLYITIFGIAACVFGYLLRRKRRYAGIGAIIVSLPLFFSPPVIGSIISISVIVLVVTKWKELS